MFSPLSSLSSKLVCCRCKRKRRIAVAVIGVDCDELALAAAAVAAARRVGMCRRKNGLATRLAARANCS